MGWMDVGGIRFLLKLDASGLKAGMDEAKASLMSWRTETLESTREMAKWGAAITATVAPYVAAGAAAYAAVEKYGAMADQIRDLSTTTGLSTEKIQQLKYAATLSTTEFSTVTTGVNTFTLAVAEAGDTTSAAGKAFAALGVSTDGRSFDQVWDDTAAALARMENETRRNEIASTLYGRSWREMVPYIETYVEKSDEIQRIDYLTEEQLKDLEDAKVALDSLGERWTLFAGGKVAGGLDLLDKIENGSKIWSDALHLNFKGLREDAEKSAELWRDVQDDFDPAEMAKKKGLTGTGKPILTLFSQEDWEKLQTQTVDPYANMTASARELAILEDKRAASLTALNTALANPTEYTVEEIKTLSDAYHTLDEEVTNHKTEMSGEEDRVNSLVDAYKDYRDALKGVADAQKDIDNLTADYQEDVTESLTLGDLGAVRSLTKSYTRSMRDRNDDLATEKGEMSEAGNIFNQIKAGTPLAEIPGTDEYIRAQAAAAGGIEDLVTAYDGREITLTVNADTTPAETAIRQYIYDPLGLTVQPSGAATPTTAPVSFSADTLPKPFISTAAVPGPSPATATPEKDTAAKSITVNVTGPITVTGDGSFNKMINTEARIAAMR